MHGDRAERVRVGHETNLVIMTSFEKLTSTRHYLCRGRLHKYVRLHLYTLPTDSRYPRAGPVGHVAIAACAKVVASRPFRLYSSRLRSNRQAHLVATASLACLHLVTYVVCGQPQ